MSSCIGESVRVTVFGQSHSPAVGCVVEGLPSGFEPDMDRLEAFMARRAPGQGAWATTRQEKDVPRIVSGLNPQGRTCGAPLAAIIENTDTRSQDYSELSRIPRPGHADWVAEEKWAGAQDVAGGGHFSGRLTAPLCLAGGICLQILSRSGVRVGAHLARVADIVDEPFDAVDLAPSHREHLVDQMDALEGVSSLPTLDATAGQAMLDTIVRARDEQDSVGGVIECVACGMPTGIGSPMFDGIENLLARALFGIPAVKGLEFGAGFSAATMRGSTHNDPYGIVDGDVHPLTNNAGGILGGITTGEPILFRVAIKPTASIARAQRSVDLVMNEACELRVRGRHDPCIAPRAVPVVEAVCAIALLDAWLTFPAEATRPVHTS